jgi:DNA-binding MarR family transcriptional regulator
VEELSAELVLLTGRLTRALTRRSSGPSTRVPAASLRLLSQVDELAPVTIGALAASDRCSQPTMSAAVPGLVERGWATKVANPQDARSSLVSLTDDGRGVLLQARRERAQVVAGHFRSDPRHDERDLATAVAVLRGLLDQPSSTTVPDTTEATRTPPTSEEAEEEGTA